jgi:hypothetical protein
MLQIAPTNVFAEATRIGVMPPDLSGAIAVRSARKEQRLLDDHDERAVSPTARLLCARRR